MKKKPSTDTPSTAILRGEKDRKNLAEIISFFVDSPMHRGRVAEIFSNPSIFGQKKEDGKAVVSYRGKKVLLVNIRNFLYAKCPVRTDMKGPMHTRPRKTGLLAFSCLEDVLRDMVYWRGSRPSGPSCALGEDGVITVPPSVLPAPRAGGSFHFPSC